MEYIIGFIAIVVIIIYYIGMVVWQDTHYKAVSENYKNSRN